MFCPLLPQGKSIWAPDGAMCWHQVKRRRKNQPRISKRSQSPAHKQCGVSTQRHTPGLKSLPRSLLSLRPWGADYTCLPHLWMRAASTSVVLSLEHTSESPGGQSKRKLLGSTWNLEWGLKMCISNTSSQEGAAAPGPLYEKQWPNSWVPVRIKWENRCKSPGT